MTPARDATAAARSNGEANGWTRSAVFPLCIDRARGRKPITTPTDDALLLCTDGINEAKGPSANFETALAIINATRPPPASSKPSATASASTSSANAPPTIRRWWHCGCCNTVNRSNVH